MTENLKKRTSHYIQNPATYEITCDKCGGDSIEWSEYEDHIYCFDCKKDVKGTKGVFDGPIPLECAKILGLRFDRWDMVNKCVIPFEKKL
jgi:hypothetical protein